MYPRLGIDRLLVVANGLGDRGPNGTDAVLVWPGWCTGAASVVAALSSKNAMSSPARLPGVGGKARSVLPAGSVDDRTCTAGDEVLC